MYYSEKKKIENEIDISLAKRKGFFTDFENETHVWTEQLIIYNNKYFKLLAIINQIF